MLFLSGKTGKTMNSDHTTRRLVPSFFLCKTTLFWNELGIFTEFQFSPQAFN
jgi:hypothetical protein